MKKSLLLLAALAFTISSAFAQTLMYEPFNYTDGAQNTENELIRTSGGYWAAGPSISTGSTTNDDIVTSPFIPELIGLPAQQGNAYFFRGGGNDPVHNFTARTSGDVYWSAFLDVQGWTTYAPGSTGKQLLSLVKYNPPSTSISYPGSITLKAKSTTIGETKFFFGVTNEHVGSAAIGNYSTTEFSVTDTSVDPTTVYFVVVRYNIDTATTTLWVNPTFSGTTMTTDTPTATITGSSGGGQVDEVNGFFIRLDANANTPSTILDEIRVGLTWADVVSNTPLLSVAKSEIEGLNVYPNPAKDYLTVESSKTKISSVEMYNILGAKVLSNNTLVDNKLNVSSLAKGVYVLKINAESSASTRKIVIE
ncbi:T9SS type A sorting domain-containing protein [Mariniflexile gromovii]|uniref:T9SS type A sorting domain-containing protein n=1 Tax=Mariniflexile gromovii TaxID=362523 RepID=A0ABS4BWG6_9FLAO|nr:T9SS type A sorting domain-containing protein [Mariniflexile gromovii]MBP0904912.1 T9SS type A sorting domain-containing protein [Mariniflexile gromovii]